MCAFVCPSPDEANTKMEILRELKQSIEKMEAELSIGANPVCVPVCVPLCEMPPCFNPCMPCCPPCKNEPEPETEPVCEPPDVMVCYKVTNKRSNGQPCPPCPKKKQSNNNNHNKKMKDCLRYEIINELHSSKSRELRASILYTGCGCLRRDGLQDDCQRTGCHGSPECLTQPPTCPPSLIIQERERKQLLLREGNGKNKKRCNGNGNGNGKNNGNDENCVSYKCYPAVIKKPVCCNLPCLPCPMDPC